MKAKPSLISLGPSWVFFEKSQIILIAIKMVWQSNYVILTLLQVSISQYFPLLIHTHITEGIQNRDVERQAKKLLIRLAVDFQQS